MVAVVQRCDLCGTSGGHGVLAGATRHSAGHRRAGRAKIAVSVAKVEGQDVERSVQIVGTLMAQDEVTLGTEVPSTIAKILVDMGDRVQAGQVVIKWTSARPGWR